MAVSRRDPDVAGTDTGFPGTRSMRYLYAVHRCLPDGCAYRAIPTRFQPVHRLSHDREARFDCRRTARAYGTPSVWL